MFIAIALTPSHSDHQLLHDEGSPGLVFRLTESALCAALEQAAKSMEATSNSDAAGKLEFIFEDEPQQLADAILNRYYRRGEAA
jgi:hypothetical protein